MPLPLTYLNLGIVSAVLDPDTRRHQPVTPFAQLNLRVGDGSSIRTVELSRTDLLRLLEQTAKAVVALEPKR